MFPPLKIFTSPVAGCGACHFNRPKLRDDIFLTTLSLSFHSHVWKHTETNKSLVCLQHKLVPWPTSGPIHHRRYEINLFCGVLIIWNVTSQIWTKLIFTNCKMANNFSLSLLSFLLYMFSCYSYYILTVHVFHIFFFSYMKFMFCYISDIFTLVFLLGNL